MAPEEMIKVVTLRRSSEKLSALHLIPQLVMWHKCEQYFRKDSSGQLGGHHWDFVRKGFNSGLVIW